MSSKVSSLAFSLFVFAAIGAYAADRNGDPIQDADVVLRTGLPAFSFVSYTGIGGGAFLADGKTVPQLDFASGIQFTPWLAIGSYYSAAALSRLEHADLGVSVADTEAAYLTTSGAEILLTPWAHLAIHPLARITLGGASLGYLEDLDGEEGYDAAYEDRCFSASVSAGAELNLSRHIRLALRGGWRFVANEESMGIDEAALSGPELSLTLRVLWRTSFE